MGVAPTVRGTIMVERAKLSFHGSLLASLASLASPLAIGTLLLASLGPACSAAEPPATTGHKAKAASGADPATGTLGGSGPTDETGSAASSTGAVDMTPACDAALAVDDSEAASFAKAIGICTTAASQGFGLVSASYARAFGSTTPPHAGQWGLLPKFGSVIKPREGSTLGALSTGYAREFDNPQGALVNARGRCDWSGLPGACPVGIASDFVNSSPDGPLNGMSYPTGVAPPGFPKSGQNCQQDNNVNDMIDVKLVLKAPMDATGFRFDFDFYSSEWPNFVCSTFNDAFVAYLTYSGLTDNVSFDPNKNPVAVNNNYFDRCTAGAPLGCNRTDGNTPDAPISASTCAGGAAELDGTGYASTAKTLCNNGSDITATLGGATGWLTTQAPIKPGEQFTLEFMIWDAGDGILDSTVLIDHFQWTGGTIATPSTTRVN
jgi:hypothetical protein